MKNIRGVSVIISLVFFICELLSCTNKINNRSDLISYINDDRNGLRKTQQIGEINIALTYRPWQLMSSRGQSFGKERETTLKKQLFFVLSLSAKNRELLRQLEFSRYSEMVQVLAFRMKTYIDVLPDNSKPVEPMDCIFQQTYGMEHANNLLIVFDRTEIIKANSLKFRIKEFGLRTGDLEFELKTNDIKAIPFTTMN